MMHRLFYLSNVCRAVVSLDGDTCNTNTDSLVFLRGRGLTLHLFLVFVGIGRIHGVDVEGVKAVLSAQMWVRVSRWKAQLCRCVCFQEIIGF
jgi:hypothetical protein